jgi:hypothetical protein
VKRIHSKASDEHGKQNLVELDASASHLEVAISLWCDGEGGEAVCPRAS